MNMQERESIKLAAAILIQKGHISIADITALPMVSDTDVAQKIANKLVQSFQTTTETRSIGKSSNTVLFEDVIVLKGFKSSRDLGWHDHT